MKLKFFKATLKKNHLHKHVKVLLGALDALGLGEAGVCNVFAEVEEVKFDDKQTQTEKKIKSNILLVTLSKRKHKITSIDLRRYCLVRWMRLSSIS